MTEEQIERWVEIRMDALDHRLMSGAITQPDYDQQVKLLDRAANEMSCGQARSR